MFKISCHRFAQWSRLGVSFRSLGLRCQGFIQDFSTGGGGRVQHQCGCAATHVTRGEGRGDYASTDLIGPVGSARLVLQFMAVR